ncbi:hypothetical protein LPJ66_009184 [Kickxella alabastrina]|uniref:Uncharacterized protein n=1 Tax=Kickxella alabastrina TaxID=61397 RepID=A0ACC1I7S2_9FUNG|nr:hypothetical protein LPJ66_009184 [Kickxella alabastrina]
MTLPYIIARRSFNFSRFLSLPLLILNSIQGILIFIQGCLSCSIGDVRHIMLGIPCLLLGFLLVLMETVHLATFRMYASFLFSFFGRGLLYLVLGCMTLEGGARRTAELGIGLEIALIGLVFLGMTLSNVYFDDPADEYAMVIHNIQNGFHGNGDEKGGRIGRVAGGGNSEKNFGTVGAYSGQGISSETYAASAVTSFIPYTSTGGYAGSMASGTTPGARVFAASDKLSISNPI